MLPINYRLGENRNYFLEEGHMFLELLRLQLQIFIQTLQPVKSGRLDSTFNYFMIEGTININPSLSAGAHIKSKLTYRNKP
jgi:hypothetical protein